MERESAARLLRPYLKRLKTNLPWVIAKWAMTLDGRIATRSNDSRWISNASSREWTHRLRGRMDAIMVGIGTVLADDPLLTARPAGPRVPKRVVFDRSFRLPLDSQLVRTLEVGPVWVFGRDAESPSAKRLAQAGCHVLGSPESSSNACQQLLESLSKEGCTNVLIEGGSSLLGSFFDADLVDEAHIFIGNHIVGGAQAIGPVGGIGSLQIRQGFELHELRWDFHEGDVHASGIVHHRERSTH